MFKSFLIYSYYNMNARELGAAAAVNQCVCVCVSGCRVRLQHK